MQKTCLRGYLQNCWNESFFNGVEYLFLHHFIIYLNRTMNYIDIILVLLLIFSAISGFRKGLIVELASLAALILGIWGAIEFSDITSEFLVENFNWEPEYLSLIHI